MKSFLGNFYRNLAIFFWSHWTNKSDPIFHLLLNLKWSLTLQEGRNIADYLFSGNPVIFNRFLNRISWRMLSSTRIAVPANRSVLKLLLSENTVLRGSITLRLTSCLTGLDLTKQMKCCYSTHVKLPNSSKINRRSAIQWYFPLMVMNYYTGLWVLGSRQTWAHYMLVQTCVNHWVKCSR